MNNNTRVNPVLYLHSRPNVNSYRDYRELSGWRETKKEVIAKK